MATLSEAGSAGASSVGTPSVGAPATGNEALAWRSWPAAERPGQAVVVALAILAASFGLGMYGGDPVLGGIAFAILTLSLAPFFFPTRYRIDETGVEAVSVFGSHRREWPLLRSYVADARGITVSPFLHASWLESYRGMRLLYSGNREAVVAAVAARLDAMSDQKKR